MVEESGFIFTPPDAAWFRFADVPTYRHISGAGLAEMDFAYWDAPRDRLVLLEVKDYTGREAPTHLVDRLIAKGRDSLIMLQSAWRAGDAASPAEGAGKRHGGRNGNPALSASLAGELPERLRVRSRVRLIFVLKVDATTRMKPINAINDQVAAAVRVYAKLLDLTCDTLLMTQEKACMIGLPLRVSPPRPS